MTSGPEELPQSIIDLEAASLVGMLGAEVSTRDFNRLDSEPVVYRPRDRPLAGGQLPVVSAAGDPSHLARVGDPKDALGSTHDEAIARLRHERGAEVIARAAAVLRKSKTPHSPAPLEPRDGPTRDEIIDAEPYTYPTMLRDVFSEED